MPTYKNAISQILLSIQENHPGIAVHCHDNNNNLVIRTWKDSIIQIELLWSDGHYGVYFVIRGESTLRVLDLWDRTDAQKFKTLCISLLELSITRLPPWD